MAKVISDKDAYSMNVPAGHLYYSKEQRKYLDKINAPRFFGELIFKDGRTKVVEYTEMIDFASASQKEVAGPWQYEDAIYLGQGIFHHSEEA